MMRWLRELFHHDGEVETREERTHREVREDRDAAQERRMVDATRKANKALREISRVEEQFEAQVRLRGRKFE